MKPVDSISVSVIQHKLESIVEEMDAVIKRAVYPYCADTSRHFASAIFDGLGRLVTQSRQVPQCLGALSMAVQSSREFFEANLRSGDIYLLSDPYCGCTNQQELILISPVFAGADDVPSFWALSRSQRFNHVEVDSAREITPRSLQISPLKLYDGGVARGDVLQMVLANIYRPGEFKGELQAMIGSNRVAEQRLSHLLETWDATRLQQAINRVLDRSDGLSRSRISRWDDGVYVGESHLQGRHYGNDKTCIRAIVTKKSDSIHVDLTESDPQLQTAGNATYANTVAAIHRALVSVMGPGIIRNEGFFRPVGLTTKPGTVIHPLAPAPVTSCSDLPGRKIHDAVYCALSAARSGSGGLRVSNSH